MDIENELDTSVPGKVYRSYNSHRTQFMNGPGGGRVREISLCFYPNMIGHSGSKHLQHEIWSDASPAYLNSTSSFGISLRRNPVHPYFNRELQVVIGDREGI